MPALPVSHGIVIAQLMLDVVKLCAKFANVELDEVTTVVAGADARKDCGKSQACAILAM